MLQHTFAPRLHQPARVSWRDTMTVGLALAAIVLAGIGVHNVLAPFSASQQSPISLSPWALPGYALRSTLRMFAALGASLLFTFTYATIAAKSRRAEMLLIPLLDVLQSVPILGYLSFTVVFFVALFPGRMLGPELAAIFAIFTSQAWNMAFSFYQTLRTVPRDLDEAARALRLTPWQRFWQLEVPFSMPGLVWNTMMSMSGGWFFVVASEAISVGNTRIMLPGVGSYVATAIRAGDMRAVCWAIAAMAIVIVLYDQLFFRPVVAWADKFRADDTASQHPPRSWLLDIIRTSNAGAFVRARTENRLRAIACARLAPKHAPQPFLRPLPQRVGDALWYAVLAGVGAFVVWQLVHALSGRLTFADVRTVSIAGAITLLRVAVLLVIASVIWVPVGVVIGLRPVLAGRVQALAQMLAAFPANLLFPIFVVAIVRFHLTPAIWLTPLMILGTQWYILFNVVAGASAYPMDLREAANSFRIRGARWWRDVMLPGIFPYYVTGAITASGGAWNASIVAETVTWSATAISGGGLGAYIAAMTAKGDFARVGLGIAMMAFIVVCANRLIWRPLYAFGERRARLD